MAYKKDKEKDIRNLVNFDDDKINVIVMGISGSGKSTLINAVMEEEVASTGVGDPVSGSISIYENDKVPFRMIDTVGYEFGIFRQLKIKSELKKFCEEGVKKNEIEKMIHAIWFCIDGTSKRVEQNTLDYIKSVSNDWQGVPIIVVLTKSYSEIEIEENINMAQKAVEKYNSTHKKRKMNVVDFIPVVALDYQISESITVSQRGLDELVEKTADIAPEAKKIAEDNIIGIDLKMKKRVAQSIVIGNTGAAAGVGAVNFAIPDAAILGPLQAAMLGKIAKTYNISEESQKNTIIDRLMKAGVAAIVGKTLVEQLKKIPGINIAAGIINGFVAGVVTFTMGQISINLFERIFKGEDLSAMNWDEEIQKQFDKYLPAILDSIKDFSKKNKKINLKYLKDIIENIFKKDV